MKRYATIGELDGDTTRIFGAIADVATDARRRLYVLDSRLNTVRVFDVAASFVRSFGRPGQGPMEFQAPEALEVTEEGTVLIADRHRRVKIFAAADTAVVLLRTSQVDVVPEGLCVAGERFFVQGWRQDGTVVHAYAVGGGHVASFGAAYRSDNPLVQQQLSDGPLACTREGSAVVFVYEYVPLVFAYTTDGSLLWAARLQDYEPMVITETTSPEGRPRVTYSAERPFHNALGIVGVERDLVAVQIARHDRKSVAARAEYAQLHTYLFSVASRKAVYVGARLPALGTVRLPLAYAFENDPYPRVVLLRDSLAASR